MKIYCAYCDSKLTTETVVREHLVAAPELLAAFKEVLESAQENRSQLSGSAVFAIKTAIDAAEGRG